MMDPTQGTLYLVEMFGWAFGGALAGSLARGPLMKPKVTKDGFDPGVFSITLAAGYIGMVYGNVPEHACTIGIGLGLAGRTAIKSLSQPVIRMVVDAAARRLVGEGIAPPSTLHAPRFSGPNVERGARNVEPTPEAV